MEKVYYWLKLDQGFFEDDTIAWIEEQPSGNDYILFYLKLALKSLSDDGKLIRYVGEKLIPYDYSTLARITRTDESIVKDAMRIFEDIGLVSILDNEEIYLTQIAEMTGSETDAAKRKRKSRAKKKQEQENNNGNECDIVTSGSDDQVTNSKKVTQSKSKSKSKSKSIEYRDRQLPPNGDSPQQDDDSKSEPESQPPIPYQEIIEYLNEKTGKNFNYKSTGNRKLIKARWNEGYKLEDFKQVIDNMASNWKGKTFSDGSPAENYLRPQTLFKPSKFDDYLNATPNLAHEIKIHEHQIGQEDIEAYNYLKSTGKFKVRGDEELESP